MRVIQFGRDVCDARKPRCWECPLVDRCPYPGQDPGTARVAVERASVAVHTIGRSPASPFRPWGRWRSTRWSRWSTRPTWAGSGPRRWHRWRWRLRCSRLPLRCSTSWPTGPRRLSPAPSGAATCRPPAGSTVNGLIIGAILGVAYRTAAGADRDAGARGDGSLCRNAPGRQGLSRGPLAGAARRHDHHRWSRRVPRLPGHQNPALCDVGLERSEPGARPDLHLRARAPGWSGRHGRR